jgi:asparaginyl-tRNA synthetase
MLEPEMIGYNLEQTCNLAEEMLRAVARDVAVSCRKDLEFFETTETVDSLADGPAFARVKFADVADPCETDLPTEKEKAIAQANGPTFVTNYPAATTPFYMKRAATGATTLNFDMLLPGVGEVIGGSVREERFDVLESEI